MAFSVWLGSRQFASGLCTPRLYSQNNASSCVCGLYFARLDDILIRSLILALAALIAAQSDKATSTWSSIPTETGASSTEEPCSVISSLLAALESALPAETALVYLNSVPVDVEGDSQLIDELKIAWKWQSEVSRLKNPPEDWCCGFIREWYCAA